MLVLSLFFTGISGAEPENDGQREKLIEQHKQLSAGIERLTREQDYLVFQRTMYATDSKYLIINIPEKTGQLKYKNRVLKDFQFTLISGRIRRLMPGELMLTRKIEGPRSRNLLVFGKSLVLQGKQAPETELDAGIPRFALSRRDFKSLYAALESGAKAYVIP